MAETDFPERSRRLTAAGALALAGVVACLYAPSLGGGPVWDDRSYVLGNPAVVDAKALEAAFLSDANRGANPAQPASGLYRPLAFASYYLNARLLGPDPRSLHAGNVALHALSAALLFLALLARLPSGRRGLAAAWLAAGLWALHPEQAEAVAWISGRYDLLGTALLLGALLARRRAGPGASALQALLLLGAALSKETFLLGGLVLLADDLAPGRPRPGWRRLAPLGLAALAWAALRAHADVTSLAGADRPASALVADYLSGVGLYLVRAVAPLPLSLDHPYAPLGSLGLVLAAGALAAAAWAAWRRRELAGPVAAWALLLAPATLALAPAGSAPERYFLAPSLGLAWALALGLAWALERAVAPTALAAGTGLLASGWAVAARLPDWRSDEAVFAAALRDRPEGWFGAFHLGLVRARDGAPREAVALLERAEAEAEAQGAPTESLGQVLDTLSLAYLRLGDAARAAVAAHRAVALAPRYPGFHLTLAFALAAGDDLRSELTELDAALSLSPAFHRARGFRALARAQTGDADGCRADLEVLETRGGAERADWERVAAEARIELNRTQPALR